MTDEILTMPADPCDKISIAITATEEAATRAFEYGRFWMRQSDHAHGRRWFARYRELSEIAVRLRQIQYQSLHPDPVGTPTRSDTNAECKH